jgi:glycerol kinase
MNAPVVRPKVIELTALGAGFLAGLAVKFWKDEASIAAYWQHDKTFKPQMDRTEAAARMRRWNKAIACAKLWEEE